MGKKERESGREGQGEREAQVVTGEDNRTKVDAVSF